MVPCRTLLDKSMDDRVLNAATLSKLPVISFKLMSSPSSFVAARLGIVPLKRFPGRRRYLRSVHFAMESGIVPEIRLSSVKRSTPLMCKDVSLLNVLMVFGRVPLSSEGIGDRQPTTMPPCEQRADRDVVPRQAVVAAARLGLEVDPVITF
jgi:hypothetical protein